MVGAGENEDPFEVVTIGNEEEAFDLLSKALEKKLGDQQIQLNFTNWPVLEIKLEGPGYDSTITPAMAEGLIELQHAINRSYARIVRHSADARSLTDSDRNNIQFKAKVEKGSSLVTVNLGDFAQKVAIELIGKMSPMDLVIMVLGLAITGGGLLAYKAFLKQRTEAIQIGAENERLIALSQQETKRLEIFKNAVLAQPKLQSSLEDFDDARREIVRGTGDAESISISGVKMDRELAKMVGAAKRSESRPVQLNGDYFILETNWKKDSEARLKVRNVATNQEFIASLPNESLDQEETDMLQEAEWNRSKVYMSINAAELRGSITTATIVSVTKQPEEDLR